MKQLTKETECQPKFRPTCHLGVEACEGNIYCDVCCLGYMDYRDKIVKEKCRKIGLNEYQAKLCSHWTNSKRIYRKREAIDEYIQEFLEGIGKAITLWRKSLKSGPGLIKGTKNQRIKKIIKISEKIGCQEWYGEEILEAIQMVKMPECLRDIFYNYCSTQYHIYGQDKYNCNDGHPNGYANMKKFARILNGDNLSDEKFGMWGNKKKEGRNQIFDRQTFIKALIKGGGLK